MGLEAAAVAAAIAALSVSGVKTIRDLDEVKTALAGRDCPLVYPAPDDFLTLENSRQLTLGPAALWEYTYTLKYRFVQAPVGSERTLAQTLPSKIDNYLNFIHAISANATALGAKHVSPAGTPEWGVLEDAAGQQFQAADILLRVVSFSAD